MEVTYSWIIFSCLIFGTGILCDRKLDRRQAASSCSANTDDKFSCLNGLCIEWPWVCDGYKDCSDGSDETQELCAIYEFGTNMTMDCGRLNIKNQVISEDGNLSLADQSFAEVSPWTVSIYRNTFQLKFILFGTIIAPNIVISMAEGLRHYGINSKQTSINDGQFKIGGFPFRLKMIDPVKKLINVTTIYMAVDYNNSYKSKSPDYLSVLVLANKISFGYGYEPVCIDWFRKYNKWNETQIKIVGAVNRTHRLKSTIGFFPYINDITCLKVFNDSDLVAYDNICIRLTDQDADYRIPGLDISFLHSNTYFLTGVIMLENHQDKFIKNTLLGITDIKYYIPWIRGILNKHVTVNSCILPTAEGVIYSDEYSNEILSHGTLVDRYINVVENCEVGYHKASRYRTRFCLGKGKWLSSSDKLCFKMCPPLESDSLAIKCTYNGKYANCSNPSIPDTIAIALCKPLYTAPNGHEKEPLELLCQPNGTWNKELYNICNPSCGKINTINNGLITGGGTAPWNVGVYEFNKTISNNYDLICGGSIISPNLVVSAAHCFWKKYMESNRRSVNADLYKIAVGKYSRNITIIDNEFTKIINVETVHLNEDYHGYPWFHADDIAIVVLRNRISFSIHVLPICVDWLGINTIPNGAEGKDYHGYSGFHADDIAVVVLRDTISFSIRVSPVCVDWIAINIIPNGTKGKIVGWGKTEKGIYSPVLREASLPYIDQSTCRKMCTNGFELFVTKDKFCAGSELGQGLHDGDSGAGLSFLHSNLYYLIGVASVKDPDTNNSIAVFTEVKYHIQWIRRLYDEHH